MVTLKGTNHELTLKACHKNSKLNDLVIKENGATTLVAEEKTIYMFVESEKKCLRDLGDAIATFVSTSKYDININIESFMEYYQPKHEEAFRVIVETTMYYNHKAISMKQEQKEPKSFNFVYGDIEEFDEIYKESEIKMEFVNFARDLQDLPPNVGTSVEIAKRLEEKAKTVDGVKVTVYGKKEIEDMGMGLLLAVNAGSHVDPRVVVLEYNGDSSKPKTALVGKGITFDSGGYNLKPSNFISDMKFDMSGSVIMASTLMALAKSKAKTNIMSVAMLTDNRIGGHATLTEAVVKSMNGKTVQIDNTDAEGRLVLADGITYAVRNGKADQVIDAATLTGAIVVALGKWYTGAFSTNDQLWEELEVASKTSLERVWRQPLLERGHLAPMQKTPIADLTNSEPGREAGSSTAAAFLNVFAEGKPFLHLDIAGTADDKGRGKGVMIRTLFEMLK